VAEVYRLSRRCVLLPQIPSCNKNADISEVSASVYCQQLASTRAASCFLRSLVLVSLKTRHKISMSTTNEQLFKALSHGKHDEVERLVEAGADVNCKDKYGFTPLHRASEKDDMKAVRFFFDNGADVHCKSKHGDTPLHLAAAHGRTEIVLSLAWNGADVDRKNKYGDTPLHDASQNGSIDAAFVLIDHGADFSIKNDDGKTALDVAKSKGVSSKLSHKFFHTWKKTCPAAIQGKLEMLIQENKQQKAEITELRDKLKSTTATLSQQHKKEIAAIQEKVKSERTALSEQHKVEIAALQEKLKKTTAAISEQHKVEIAALSEQHKEEITAVQENTKSERVAISEQQKEDSKLEMNALSEQHIKDIASVNIKLNTVIRENKRLKSAKSLAGPKHAKAEADAEQAKDDRIFKLMMKRKQLQDAGISATEIDEQLPLPVKDDEDMPSTKRRRRVVKKEEET
jgi:hypothetical protein